MILTYVKEGKFTSGDYVFITGTPVDVTDDYAEYLVSTFPEHFEKQVEEVVEIIEEVVKDVKKANK